MILFLLTRELGNDSAVFRQNSSSVENTDPELVNDSAVFRQNSSSLENTDLEL